MTFIQRVILLLATPILAQFIFVLVLLGAFRTVEQINYKDLQYRNQTADLMTTSTLCYKAIGMISAFAYSKDKAFLKGFDTIYEKLERKTEVMNLLAQQNGAEAKTAVRTSQSLKRVLAELLEVRQTMNLDVESVGSKELRALEIQRDLGELLSGIESILAQRTKTSYSENKSIQKGRTLFLSAVIGGFIVNMLMSAALMLLFARDFAKRFNVIVDNTNRLPQGEKLNPPLEGKDELAALDRFFHKMTSELKAIEERKEQLVAMVTHDLRNPLAALHLALEAMGAGVYGPLNDEQEYRLESSGRVVKRLTGLVNDILDLEKLKSGKLKLTLASVEIDNVIEDCINELEPIAKAKNVNLEFDSSEQLIVADSERLAQIIINLLGNAIKFTAKDTSVQIKQEMIEDFLKIKIIDHGPGVPENYRDVIFLPFEQVPDDKRTKKGSTGLGLPISKMLVDLHGGKIGVESNSEGSTFWFTMHAAETEAL